MLTAPVNATVLTALPADEAAPESAQPYYEPGYEGPPRYLGAPRGTETGPMPRAASGPMPRAATGPLPRTMTGPFPAAPATPQSWTGPMPRADDGVTAAPRTVSPGSAPRGEAAPRPRGDTGPMPAWGNPPQRRATGPMPQAGGPMPPPAYRAGGQGSQPDYQEWAETSYDSGWLEASHDGERYPEQPPLEGYLPGPGPDLRFREPGPGMPGYRGSREHRYGGDRY